MLPPLVTRQATTFATSIALPPPTPMTVSARAARAASAHASTLTVEGLGSMPLK